MTRSLARLGVLVCIAASSGCSPVLARAGSTSDESDIPIAPPPPTPWDGCDVSGQASAVVATCSWGRIASRTDLPSVDEAILRDNAQRYFAAAFPREVAGPVENVSMRDGAPAWKSVASGMVTDAQGATRPRTLMMFGVQRAGGGGLLLSCAAPEAATCLHDIDQMYVSPPVPLAHQP